MLNNRQRFRLEATQYNRDLIDKLKRRKYVNGLFEEKTESGSRKKLETPILTGNVVCTKRGGIACN